MAILQKLYFNYKELIIIRMILLIFALLMNRDRMIDILKFCGILAGKLVRMAKISEILSAETILTFRHFQYFQHFRHISAFRHFGIFGTMYGVSTFGIGPNDFRQASLDTSNWYYTLIFFVDNFLCFDHRCCIVRHYCRKFI
jgi:hypothetical protein